MNIPTSTMTLRWPMACVLAVLSMLLLPALTHSILTHPPEYDELLHILAARSINETGMPGIADGLYTRARLFTNLTAWVTGFGDADSELLVARLPALMFGMLLTAMLTAWVGARVGWVAALAVAGIFVIAPMTLNASVLVRFYTLHTLLMTMLLLFWFEASRWRRTLKNLAIFLVLSAALIGLGMHLHDLTQITILSGVTALSILLIYDYRQPLSRVVGQWPFMSVLMFLLFIGLVIFIAISVDIVALLRGTLPLWSVNRAGNYAFYISAFSVDLPFLWPLFPVMVFCAFYEQPRLALFCLTAFIVSLIVNSIAAQKATRYFYHAYPMFCILWAVGFQRAFFYGYNELRKFRGVIGACAIMLTALSLCLVSSHEIKRGIKLVLDRGQLDDTIPVKNEPDWLLSLPRLSELAQSVDTLVVTSGVKGQFTFGRFDYEMSTTVVQETETGLEFGNDPRTNRQVIGLAESVEKVIDAEGQALFVLEDRMINKAYSSPVESISVLNRRCDSIDLSDTGSQLSAWLC